MSTFISKMLAACGLTLAAATLCAAHAANATGEPQKAAKAKPASKARAKAAAAAVPDEPEPDISGTTTTEYQCELGNKITIYHKENDDGQIALRWKQRLHRLTRVGTTTGARRFENPVFGLIWIGIPAKGMLLDSKQNRQLANECKNAEQAKPAMAETAELKKN